MLQDNSEVYGGVKPEEQLVVAQERVNKIIVAISFEEVQLDLDKELLDFRPVEMRVIVPFMHVFFKSHPEIQDFETKLGTL